MGISACPAVAATCRERWLVGVLTMIESLELPAHHYLLLVGRYDQLGEDIGT
jgi:hypothetical protein